MIDFETFDGFIKVYDELKTAANELIEIGFDIYSKRVARLHDQMQTIIDILNKAMALEKDTAGYTTLDWFIENRYSMDEDLHRTTLNGKEYFIYSNMDCYNLILKEKQ